MSISLLKKAAAVIISVGAMCIAAIAASAATTPCTYYEGDNVSAQEYPGYRYNWAGTVNSYLSVQSDGSLMRVQATDDGVVVEYYDKNYNCTSQKLLGAELPIFGAFYETSSNYYLLTGQINAKETADVECYRLTKYTKDWKRVKSVGLYDCNTYVPFDAGSARITEEGKYLIVRTCREMYKNPSDGNHHQANVTIEYDTESMTVTDSYTRVMNDKFGYVSHSFNQFVKTENGKIVAVDHGDAYPRSVVLIKYPTSAAGGKFTPTYSNQCSTITMLSIPGQVGDNYTGVTVGGFEISSSSYIVVGSKTDLSGSSDTRNVYVSVADKSTGAVKVTELTSYSGSVYKDGATTPQLVKLGTDSFMVLWEHGDTVYYTRIDGKGNKVGAISSFTGHLSDCVPVINGGKLVWYVWADNTVDFYTIDLSSYKAAKSASLKYGHDVEVKSVSGDTATLKCKKCSQTFTEKVATDFTVWWETGTSAAGTSYSTKAPTTFDVEDRQNFNLALPDGANKLFEAFSSDASVLRVGGTGLDFMLTALKPGTATITIRPVYNPSVEKKFTIKVAHDFEEKIITQPTCAKEGQKQLTCKGCGHKETASIPKKAHSYTSKTVAPTYAAEGYTQYTCSVCGYSYKGDTTAKKTLSAVAGLALKGRAADALRFGWNADKEADGYIVEQKIDGKWQQIVKTNSTEYRVSKLAAGTAYSFRVRSFKTVGGTEYYSPYTSGSWRTSPAKMTMFKLKGRAADALRLEWNKNSSADGYIIEVQDGAKWTRVIKLTDNSTTEYRIEGLKPGTVYTYRMRAYKMSGKTALYSSYTKVYSYRTNPSAVSGLKLKNSAKDAVRLSWTQNTSADGYIIEMKSGNTWVRVGKVTKNSTVEFKKSKLKAGTAYTFRIKTYKMSGKTALYGTTKTITVKTK